MSAEVETMMYAGKVPWHKLGTQVGRAQTSEEAIKLAGLDWEVELIPIFSEEGAPVGIPLEGWNAIRRVSDKRVYSVVGKQYHPIQNSQAFAFFDEVVGGKKAIYHTAGSLYNGARTWILAQMEGVINIKGEQIDKFICLTNSHDGSTAFRIFWTPIRVVCANTLAMAENGASRNFYARHTANIQARVMTAQDVLGISDLYYEKWAEEARLLGDSRYSFSDMEEFLRTSFAIPVETKRADIYPVTRQKMLDVEKLMVTGKGMDNPAIRGTKWQMFNALAEYVDYNRGSKSTKEGASLNQAWFGTGKDMKVRGWNHLLSTV